MHVIGPVECIAVVEVASYKWSKVEFRLHFRFKRGWVVAQCAHQLEWIVVWHKWSCILVECVAVDISGTCSTKCTAGNCSKCPPPLPPSTSCQRETGARSLILSLSSISLSSPSSPTSSSLSPSSSSLVLSHLI